MGRRTTRRIGTFPEIAHPGTAGDFDCGSRSVHLGPQREARWPPGGTLGRGAVDGPESTTPHQPPKFSSVTYTVKAGFR
jgi:hypothetical protein